MSRHSPTQTVSRRRHPAYRAGGWLLAVTMTISGCQVLNDLSAATSSVADSFTRPTSEESVTEAAPQQQQQQTAAAPATTAPAAAPVIDSNPDQFLGLQGDVVAARLGAPDLIRRDGPAEVRQFRGSACVLDLFLYPDNNSLSVKHVELRGASLKQEERNACLSELIRARVVAG